MNTIEHFILSCQLDQLDICKSRILLLLRIPSTIQMSRLTTAYLLFFTASLLSHSPQIPKSPQTSNALPTLLIRPSASCALSKSSSPAVLPSVTFCSLTTSSPLACTSSVTLSGACEVAGPEVSESRLDSSSEMESGDAFSLSRLPVFGVESCDNGCGT